MVTNDSKKRLISFRVYPENRSLYAQVNIWHSKNSSPLSRRHAASCWPCESYRVTPQNKARKQGLFAELTFYRERLGVGVISHEMTHAAVLWARRRGLIDDVSENPAEERFASAVGEMCRQFTQRCYELGLFARDTE